MLNKVQLKRVFVVRQAATSCGGSLNLPLRQPGAAAYAWGMNGRFAFPLVLLVAALTGAAGCSPAPTGEGHVVTDAEVDATAADEVVITPAEDEPQPEATVIEPPEEPAPVAVEMPEADPPPAATPVAVADPPVAGPPPMAPYERPVDEVTLDSLAAAEPKLQPGMETKSFDVVGPDDAVRLSFDDLDLLKVLGLPKAVPLDVTESFPDWLRELDGRRVRLRGFMYPPSEPSGIRRFLFARDNEICCFGRDPLAYDILPVTMADGESSDYIQNRAFDVVGIFRIDPLPDFLDEDALETIYAIDDAIVIE